MSYRIFFRCIVDLCFVALSYLINSFPSFLTSFLTYLLTYLLTYYGGAKTTVKQENLQHDAQQAYQFSSVQFVTLLKQNVLRGCIGLLEQVGFKPSPKLSSTYQW